LISDFGNISTLEKVAVFSMRTKNIFFLPMKSCGNQTKVPPTYACVD